MGKSRIRLLLNAEPFGFGPTAAIAALYPYLRDAVDEVAYIGSGHTLDLQRHLPYARIYDQSSLDEEQLQEVLQHYDVMLTASDFDMARAARRAGLKICVYDPLAWYWKKFPTIAREADLYIAQDFYGVEARLQNVFNASSAYTIVPPIVEAAQNHAVAKQGILLNLGGLQNPHWSLDAAAEYARTIIASVRKVIPEGESLTIATSQAIADHLHDPDVRTYSVEAMRTLRQNCRVALMTPGLGNIFDAAAERVATLWLPPANDSQGQQADILQANLPDTSRIDWKDIMPSWEMDYKSAQTEILQQISAASACLAQDHQLQDRLSQLFKDKLAGSVADPGLLIDHFGQGGALRAAQAVTSYCWKLQSREKAYA